ncbi:MAG TPA: ACP phosphodiesterase [Phycisphaerae bacterium]|nr:ACP phosphodiesterase [Phycisphaerae bacterium]
MNLLAHALLSPSNDPAALFGNLTADWVKGRARLTLPEPIRRGMEIHQRIDAFTDLHPLVHRCTDLLEPNWARYSPILVDVFFDHVLSLEWHRHSVHAREHTIATAYAALRQHKHLLPERAEYAVNALLADDWLSTYATLDGIALSLSRMSTRLQSRGHDIELAPAVRDFQTVQPQFHAAFEEFFPQLRAHAAAVTANPVDAGKIPL